VVVIDVDVLLYRIYEDEQLIVRMMNYRSVLYELDLRVGWK
jgi:hypothetical protein